MTLAQPIYLERIKMKSILTYQKFSKNKMFFK